MICPNRPNLVIAIATALLAQMMAIPATGQPPTARKQQGERYALLVAVRDYHKASGLRPLTYTQDDVTAMADLLRQAGYRPENVVLMTEACASKDSDLLPECNKILNQLKVLLRDRNKDDSVLVAMAGHGIYFGDTKQSYFCPLDAQLDDRKTLVPMDEVYKQLESCPAGVKLLFYDACRNSPLRSASRGLDLHVEDEADLVQLSPPRGTAAFFSCSENEVAFEDSTLRHGVFFHFVIEGMRGAADLDKDGKVTLPELEQFVKRRVADYVRSQFNGKRQMPNLVGNTSGLVTLVDLAGMPPYKPSVSSGPPKQLSPQVRRVLRAPSDWIAMSPNGKMIALEGVDDLSSRALYHTGDFNDGTVRLWDVQSGKQTKELSIDQRRRSPDQSGVRWAPRTAAFSPDGKTLAAGAQDGGVRIWSAETAQLLMSLSSPERQGHLISGILSVAFSPNGGVLASGGADGIVRLWDTKKGGELAALRGNTSPVRSIAFSPNGKKLASASGDGSIRLWDPIAQKKLGVIAPRRRMPGINSVAFSPDGRLLAFGDDAGNVKLWDSEKCELLATLESHTASVNSVAFSRDGTLMASASDDGTVMLWDPNACALRTMLTVNDCDFRAVVFSPDGKFLLASTHGDRTFVWDLDSSQ